MDASIRWLCTWLALALEVVYTRSVLAESTTPSSLAISDSFAVAEACKSLQGAYEGKGTAKQVDVPLVPLEFKYQLKWIRNPFLEVPKWGWVVEGCLFTLVCRKTKRRTTILGAPILTHTHLFVWIGSFFILSNISRGYELRWFRHPKSCLIR